MRIKSKRLGSNIALTDVMDIFSGKQILSSTYEHNGRFPDNSFDNIHFP